MKPSLLAARKALALAVLAAAVIGTACTPGTSERPRTLPAPGDSAAKMAEAEGSLRRGHYLAFKKAAALLKRGLWEA